MKTIYWLFIPLLLLLACGKKTSPETVSDTGVIPVTTSPVRMQKIAAPVKVSGLLASDAEARLSFKTGGVIQRLYVDEGTRVRKGQLLATVNLTEINAQVSQAEENVKKAERDLQRVENLYRDSVATLEQFQNATTGVKVAREGLTIAQYNQGYSEIRAPREGVILKKLMNEGEIAGPGSPIFVMNGTGPADWVVRAGVPDKEWVRLRIGEAAEVALDAFPGVIFSAKISNLAQAADPMSGLYQVELRVNPQGKPLATGLFATATIHPADQVSYAVIPTDALIEGNGDLAYVFVPAGNKAERRPVKIAYLDGDTAMIYEGLSGISTVITSGSAYLLEGSPIDIQSPQNQQTNR